MKSACLIKPLMLGLFVSAPLMVRAAPTTPATPVINWMPTSYTLQNGSVDVPLGWNMWWGNNGNRWFLLQNDSAVFSASLTPSGQSAQSGAHTLKFTAPGTYRLAVKLCNDDGSTQACASSSVQTITVSGTGGGDGGGGGDNIVAPAKPVLAWMADSYTLSNGSVSVPVSWNMWWGVNGNLWRLKQNDVIVHEAALTPNGNGAQAGSRTLTLTTAGNYRLAVELCNKSGTTVKCTSSDIKPITVNGGGGGGGGWDPWKDLNFAGWPQPLKQNNLPYTNTTRKMVGGYFVEWGIYGRNYHVADIPARNLTHIFYGFIPVCGPNESLRRDNPSGHAVLVAQCQGKQNYEVVVHDKFAALEKSYPNDKWDQPIRGIYAEMYRLKKTHPNIRILPSVGGWTLSDPLYAIGTQPAARAVFIRSIIDFIKKYDFFDGVDIDWEYPGGGGALDGLGTPQDGAGFAVLMRELRVELDKLEQATGREYQLTAAVNGGVEKLSRIDWENAHPHMDYINLMTYDYYGAWDATLGHMTGLKKSAVEKNAGYNAEAAVNVLRARGVPLAKVTLGAAMYGRGWKNVTGSTLANPFAGRGGEGVDGSWEKGVVDYKDIESKYLGGVNGTGKDGFVLGWDDVAKASWVFNPVSNILIGFDTQRSVKEKGRFVLDNQLGGIFAWELDGDNGHILNAMHDGLNHPKQ